MTTTFFCYAPDIEDETQAEQVDALCTHWAAEQYAETCFMRGDPAKDGETLDIMVSRDGESFWKKFLVRCVYAPSYCAELSDDQPPKAEEV